MRVRLCVVISALIMVVGSVRAAHAGSLVFTLASSAQSGVQGGMAAFYGTITNTDTADVFLNGVVSSISSSDLTVDDQPFFLNTPLFLPPGGSFTGHLFNVDIGPQASSGAFQGSFTIQGGTDANAFDTLASAPFSVTVSILTPFAAFTATLSLAMGLSPGMDRFDLNGAFTLGSGNNGIDPLTENVSLKLEGEGGTFVTTIPAGSFHAKQKGQLTFEGTIDGVGLKLLIKSVSSTQFTFEAKGTAADLSGLANPVTVTLTIGGDSGTTIVTAQNL